VPVERATLGSFQPPFEMVVRVPLPPIEMVVGSYRHFKRQQESNSGLRLFRTMLNPTIYFRKIKEKIFKKSGHTMADRLSFPEPMRDI
jgi:hypothetical protein